MNWRTEPFGGLRPLWVNWRSVLLTTAGDDQSFAGDPRRIGRSEERGGRRDVVHLADATERSLRFDLFAEVAFMESGSVQAFGDDHAGVDGVDADPMPGDSRQAAWVRAEAERVALAPPITAADSSGLHQTDFSVGC